MKELILFALLFLSFFGASGQVLYDNGPIILDGSSAHFSVHGNKWSSNALTYFFQNGTGDISGAGERQAIRDAFELWACVTPLTFSEVSTASNADIVILWGNRNHGDGFPFDGTGNLLAHAFFPPPNGGSIAGDIHFDDEENWTLSYKTTPNQPIDLVTVAAHEIGHSIGLRHSSNPDALMYAYYSGSHRFLHVDDIEGIQSIYGNGTDDSGLDDIRLVCFSPVIINYLDPCGNGIVVNSWTSSSNIQMLSYNSSSVTIRAINSSALGNGWVRALLSDGQELTDNFDVGTPNLNFRYSLENISLPNNSPTSLVKGVWSQVRVTCSSSCGDLNGGRWEYTATNSSTRNGSNNTLLILPNSETSRVKISYRSCNDCGCSNWHYNWFDVVQGGLIPTGEGGEEWPGGGF